MGEVPMFHVAIRQQFSNYGHLAECINDNFDEEGREGPLMMADLYPESLKKRVQERLSRNPNEKWLILSGNVTAQAKVEYLFT